jgi:hypothetical protein
MMEHTSPDTLFIDHISMTCSNCYPTMMFNPSLHQHILEHISAHILHNPSIDHLSEPCGLCLQPASLCKIFLKKMKGQKGNLTIDIKVSSCLNLVKFSITVIAECSDSSPYMNRPIICPYCGDLKLTPAV